MRQKTKYFLLALAFAGVSIIISKATLAAGSFGLESATVLDKATDVVAENPIVSGNTATSTIVFHLLDDFVTYNLSLKNSTTTSFKILDITDNNTNEFVEYTYDNHADEVVDAGQALDLEVTITYIQEHLDDDDRTQNNDVTFVISYQDLHTGVVEEEEVKIILVPNTGEAASDSVSANIASNVLLIVAIITGAVLVIVILRKKKGAATILALVITVVAASVLGISAIAEENDASDMNVNMNSEIRLRDQMCGEVYWKDPDTGADVYMSPDDFGCDDYDPDNLVYFGDIFNPSWIPAPDGLMVTGFRFTGTNTDVDLDALILDDYSVTLLYGERTYSITYDYNGGTVATANPTTVKKTDQAFTLNKPTKDTAYFNCWQGSNISYGECLEDVTIDPSTVNDDLEYKALFHHEVIVNDQYGNELVHDFIPEGHDGITYSKTIYPEGYTVNSGSCTNGQRLRIVTNLYEVDGLTNNTVCTVNITPKTYDVELVVNNGSGSATKRINHGQDATFTGIAPNTDYTLIEKVSCTNGQTAIYSNGTVTVENVTGSTTCTMNALPPTIHTITYMQEMTPEICAATTTPSSSLETGSHIDWNGSHYGDSNYTPRTALIDNRDNQKYLIEKLADGECWMMQNLSLALSTEKTFTSEDTDLNTISSYTPIRNTENIIVNVQNPYGEDKQALYTAQLSWYPEFPYFVGTDEFPYNGVTPSDSPTDDSDEYLWQKTGNLYSASAVTAGTYTFAAGADFYTQDTICPKGWTLPDNALIDPNGTNPPNDKSLYKLMYTYSPNNQSTDYLHFAESGIFSQTFGGYYQSRQGAGMSGFSTMNGVKYYTEVAYLGEYFRDAYGTGRSNPFMLAYARFLFPNYPYVQIQTSNSNVLTFHGAYARCIAR